MNIEIITIGREILDGRVVDTNSAFFGQQLSAIGQIPKYFQRVDDIEVDILDAFKLASTRSSHVIVSGGLGPTSDDITAEVFAKFVGRPWLINEEAQAHVRTVFERMQRPIHDSQWKQAKLAEGALVMPNPHGTAPGFWFDDFKTKWFFMPGVPREMKPMFLNHVLPKIPQDICFKKQMWMTHFTSEGELQQRLKDIIESLPPEISFFYRTRFPENHLGLSGSLKNAELLEAFHNAATLVDSRLGNDVYSCDENLSLEALVVQLALESKVSLSTVESCTGGLVSSRLTDISGASNVLVGAHVAYSNEFKIELAQSVGLGEAMKLALQEHGAVSKPVAELMAQAGARNASRVGHKSKVLCVSTTGIAGPGGGSAEKPVGTCWLALSDGDQALATFSLRARLGLERDQLKLLFSQKALDLLRLHLKA